MKKRERIRQRNLILSNCDCLHLLNNSIMIILMQQCDNIIPKTLFYDKIDNGKLKVYNSQFKIIYFC